jgi:hypothetical protein
MSDQSIIPLRVTTKEVSLRGRNTPHNLRGNNKALSGHQLQGAEAPGASGGRFGDQPRKIYCLFCGEDKGHTTRMCLLGRRQSRYPSLDAFANLAAQTEAKRPAGSTLRPLRCKTKAYDDVAHVPRPRRHEGPRGIRPIVTGPAWLSVLRA